MLTIPISAHNATYNLYNIILTYKLTELSWKVTCNIRCWPGAVWATWAWARWTRLRRTWWRQPGWSQATERCRSVFSLHPHLHHSSSFTATGAAGAGQEEEEEWRQGYGQQAGQNVLLNRRTSSSVPKIFDIHWTPACVRCSFYLPHLTCLFAFKLMFRIYLDDWRPFASDRNPPWSIIFNIVSRVESIEVSQDGEVVLKSQ